MSDFDIFSEQPAEIIESGEKSQNKKRRGQTRSAVSVTPIKTENNVTLVEYRHNGKVHRVLVPVDEVTGDSVSLEVLESGIPYGEDWESVLESVVDKKHSDIIAEKLREYGLWTTLDAKKNLPAVRQAVIEGFTDVMSAFLAHINNKT